MRKAFSIFLALLLTLAAIPVLVSLQRTISDIRVREQIESVDFAEKGGTPPDIAVSTILLGGFRSFVADVLWLRMNRLQQEGRYYEMVQLANWILTVQPDNATVAQFLGWNMAFNISVIQHEDAARWRWIHKGIETLNRAIELNPTNEDSYRDLIWIFQFKFGQDLDKAQMYYKFRLATEMYALLGKTHTPDWERWIGMPKTQKEFEDRFPRGTKVYEALEFCRLTDFDSLMDAFQKNNMQLPSKLTEKLSGKDLEDLDISLRCIELYNRYRIDASFAKEVQEKFGSLDWLLPDTYAIYWAYRGVTKAYNGDNRECRRLLNQSLKMSVINGQLLFVGDQPSFNNYMLLPNLSPNLIEVTIKSYQDEIQQRTGNGGAFDVGLMTYIAQLVDTAYMYGHEDIAAKYFKFLQENMYGEAVNRTLQQFVEQRLRDMIQTGDHRQVHRIIESFIYLSCMTLAQGEHERAETYLSRAKEMYNYYMLRIRDDESRVRLKMPTFESLKRSMTEELIRTVPAMAPALKAEIQLEEATLRSKSDGNMTEKETKPIQK